jgi:hypothetical protein
MIRSSCSASSKKPGMVVRRSLRREAEFQADTYGLLPLVEAAVSRMGRSRPLFDRRKPGKTSHLELGL